jgi:hypothetical protein
MTFPRAALSDLIGDFIVYRGLEPADQRLGGWSEFAARRGLPARSIPRKSEEAYAEVALAILAQAQSLRGCHGPLAQLLYLGDTRLLDGQAFLHMQERSGWPGYAFLASENLQAPAQSDREGSLWLANRWAILADFVAANPGNERTVVVVDLDKTTMGARGRNDRPLDNARAEGVQRAVASALRESFQEAAFRRVYDEFNRPLYHGFTRDNQDYLAYLCLMLMAGIYPEGSFRQDLERGRQSSFDSFLEACDLTLRQDTGDHDISAVHQEVIAHHREGDATPFKSFRHQEYVATCERMDRFPDQTPPSLIIREEITLTGEVLDAIRAFQSKGALVFCISDKPEEASLPTVELAERGYLPLHRTRMKVLDELALRSRNSDEKGEPP